MKSQCKDSDTTALVSKMQNTWKMTKEETRTVINAPIEASSATGRASALQKYDKTRALTDTNNLVLQTTQWH